MNASPADQRRLLDVADLDRRIAQAEHRRTHPAQAARINELAALRQEQLRELTARTGVRDDAQSELRRIESDVQLAEQRRTRDADRLAQATSSKDAQALEHEIATLAQRLSGLEDLQLEAMAALEEAEASLAEQQELIDRTTTEGRELTAQAKAGIAASAGEGEQAARDRGAIVAGLPADLVADYERRAARTAGAALLRRATCEGCQIMLSSTDLNAIRQLPANAVASCPECGCILVRTEESGL